MWSRHTPQREDEAGSTRAFGSFGRVYRGSLSSDSAKVRFFGPQRFKASRRFLTARPSVRCPVSDQTSLKGTSDGVPLVSIIISTHNRAAQLAEAVESARGQDYPRLEVILINDGSIDETAEVIDSYRNDRRFRIITNSTNLGLAASLNIGIEASSGKYIARIDDDDRWTDRQKLTLQVAFLEAHAEHAVVGTAYTDESGRLVNNPASDAQIRQQMLYRCPFCHSSVLIRADTLGPRFRYNTELAYGEDWELWLRIGAQYQMANLPTATLSRTQGSDTLSRRHFQHQLDLAIALVGTYGQEYPNHSWALFFHRMARWFFRYFPANGKVHQLAARAYRRLFLSSDGQSNKLPKVR